MGSTRTILIAIPMLTLVLLALSAGIVRADEVNFDRDIRPILSNTCYKCHGPDTNKRQAELRFDVKDDLFAKRDGKPVVAAGNPEGSLLIERITTPNEDLRMPPLDQKQQLTNQQVEILKRWVKQGAPYSRHWSFEKPIRHVRPDVKNKSWPSNEIDYFVLKKIEEKGLKPSSIADKRTLVRRVSLDLTGLPPTLDELQAYLNDTSPNAYENVVDRLLKSPRYGEHFALAWLDAARYADSNGYQQDRTRTLWPWRDWVIKALNDNMPFDQFTIEQIAGDLLDKPTTEQLVATGFNRNHMLNGEGGRIAEESRVNYVIDRVETVSTIWLGLTVGCARCHDHKYDPISQKEFYQLYAYFNQIDESGRVDAGGNANPVLPVPTKAQADEQANLRRRIAKLNEELKKVSTPELQKKWEAETLTALQKNSTKPVWNSMKLVSSKSTQGQAMSLQPDGSVLVTGKNPAKDDYTVELSTDLKNITAIRLETLAHPSFTNKGLARSDSGNFVLTGFSVRAQSEKETQPNTAKITKAVADFHQGSYRIEGTLDQNPNSGWAVLNTPDMTITRHAVFEFEKPITGGPKTKLFVTMRHQSVHKFHNIGRFRLTVTDQEKPGLKDSSDRERQLLLALSRPSGQRTKEQQQLIDAKFRKSAPAIKRISSDINAANKRIGDINKQMVRTMIMRDRANLRDTYLLIRGIWDKPDKSEKLFPDTPSCLPPFPENRSKNRLDLARWIVSAENPLTARVAVNRLWQHFFGQGLVKSTEDFGSQGDRPTHPQLLDWLATEFIRSKWDTKALVKQIVMSSTYRQSSKATRRQLDRDRFNTWLARGARFRMTSHAIRDQALFVSGLLVEKLGGPPVKPYQPLGIWSDLSLGKIKYQRDSGQNLYRRTLYTFWRRASAPTMLFDVASRQVCKVRPSRTNTPLHALVLLNDTTYIEAARKFAERAYKEGGATPQSRMAYAFELALLRRPTPDESQQLLLLYDEILAELKTQPKRVAALLAIGESPADDSIPKAELAAYATVANLILNLDEAITKE